MGIYLIRYDSVVDRNEVAAIVGVKGLVVPVALQTLESLADPYGEALPTWVVILSDMRNEVVRISRGRPNLGSDFPKFVPRVDV